MLFRGSALPGILITDSAGRIPFEGDVSPVSRMLMKGIWEISCKDVLLVRSFLSREREQTFIIENLLPASLWVSVFYSRPEFLQSFSAGECVEEVTLLCKGEVGWPFESHVLAHSWATLKVSSPLLFMRTPRGCLPSSQRWEIHTVIWGSSKGTILVFSHHTIYHRPNVCVLPKFMHKT